MKNKCTCSLTFTKKSKLCKQGHFHCIQVTGMILTPSQTTPLRIQSTMPEYYLGAITETHLQYANKTWYSYTGQD